MRRTPLDAALSAGAITFLMSGVLFLYFGWPNVDVPTTAKLAACLVEPLILSAVVGAVTYALLRPSDGDQ